MPAEWATHARTWMCWPCRTEAWGGPEGLLRAKQASARVARAISTFEPVTMAVRPHDAAEAKLACAGKVEMFEVPLDNSWARDIGPTFLSGRKAHACRAMAVQRLGQQVPPVTEDAQFAPRGSGARRADLWRAVDVRGRRDPQRRSGHADHHRAMLLNANRNPDLSQQEVEERLALFTGARRVIWLGEGILRRRDRRPCRQHRVLRRAGAGAGRRAGPAIPTTSR